MHIYFYILLTEFEFDIDLDQIFNDRNVLDALS